MKINFFLKIVKTSKFPSKIENRDIGINTDSTYANYININQDTDSKEEMSSTIKYIDSSFHVSQCSSDTQTTDSYISDSEHITSSLSMTDDSKVKLTWSCLKEILYFCFKCKRPTKIINILLRYYANSPSEMQKNPHICIELFQLGRET